MACRDMPAVANHWCSVNAHSGSGQATRKPVAEHQAQQAAARTKRRRRLVCGGTIHATGMPPQRLPGKLVRQSARQLLARHLRNALQATAPAPATISAALLG